MCACVPACVCVLVFIHKSFLPDETVGASQSSRLLFFMPVWQRWKEKDDDDDRSTDANGRAYVDPQGQSKTPSLAARLGYDRYCRSVAAKCGLAAMSTWEAGPIPLTLALVNVSFSTIALAWKWHVKCSPWQTPHRHHGHYFTREFMTRAMFSRLNVFLLVKWTSRHCKRKKNSILNELSIWFTIWLMVSCHLILVYLLAERAVILKAFSATKTKGHSIWKKAIMRNHFRLRCLLFPFFLSLFHVKPTSHLCTNASASAGKPVLDLL